MSATSVIINVGAQVAGAVSGLRDVQSAMGDTATSSGKAQSAVKKMAVPAAAALGVAATAAMGFAQAAAEDAQSASKMAANLQRSTGATQEQVDAMEDWITKQGQAVGVADDELRPAVERLARSTGDLGEAQDLAALSMDIAAATGKDMETVANAVAKANDGQVGALKKLGVSLGDQAENTIEYNAEQEKLAKLQVSAAAALDEFGPASKEYTAAMGKVADSQDKVNTLAQAGTDWVGELSEQFGGAAATNADTAAGKMERVQLAISETGESIGGSLLPALEALAAVMLTVAQWAQDHSTLFTILLGVVGGLAAAVLVVNAAMTAWAAITAIWTAVTTVATAVGTAFGAVMTFITGPIGLIVLAVIALIAVGVLLWKNWDKVSAAIGAAWQWLQRTAAQVWSAIVSAVGTAINAVKTVVTTVMNAIKTVFTTVWNAIKIVVTTAVNAVKTVISTVLNTVKTLVSTVMNTIKATFTTVWSAIVTAVTTAINLVSSVIDTVIGTIKTVIQTGLAVVKALFSGNFDAIPGILSDALDGVIDMFRDLPGDIVHALGSLASTLYDAGRDLIRGLIRGIQSMLSNVGNAIRDLIPDWVPGFNAASAPASATWSTAPLTAAPRAGGRATPTGAAPVLVTEEQIYRAVARLLLRGDARNGRPVMR